MAYGPAGDNVLWIDPAAGSGSATGAEPGGFLCDIGPEVAGLPPHPRLTHEPYEWSTRRNHLVTLQSSEDKTLGVELEKEILLDPATGEVGFVHRMKNTGERDSAYCLWHRIACRPGGFVLIPLNQASRFAAGWSLRREAGGRPTYDGDRPASPAVQVLEGVLVARTGGERTGLGADSTGQWIAYAVGTSLLVIHFPVYSSAVYSEGGNTVTVAWDNRMTELQPLSPEARLRPRRTYEFPMKWSLLQLPAEVTTHAAARELVSRIPGSPFL
jgi:hypothetical protein